MKKYNSPEANVIELNVADIITRSAPDSLAGNDDTAVAPDSWFN